MRTDNDIVFVEPDPGFDPDDELRPTENAIRTILDRGVFTLDAEQEFDFLAYAPSARELRDYSPWSAATTRARQVRRSRASGMSSTAAQEVLDRSESDAHIVYREQARMSRLVPS